ncbi:MAG: FkbM family methyltransferase, partial [Armatimonadota bacterium]|nr:FkbM family methyltransferase [Armatimonadota bacterium]
VEANGFAHVQLVRGAVSEATGSSFLFLSEMNQGDHRLYATAGRAKISVPNLSLDSFLLPDAPVDFIKMDIQGSEGLALRGMRATLRRNPQVQILTEFWPEGLSQAGVAPTEFLETLHGELGFTLWEVDEKRGGLKPVKDFADLIARHPGRCYTNLLCARSRQAAPLQTTLLPQT